MIPVPRFGTVNYLHLDPLDITLISIAKELDGTTLWMDNEGFPVIIWNLGEYRVYIHRLLFAKVLDKLSLHDWVRLLKDPLRLQRTICSFLGSTTIAHADADKLNCRRENLAMFLSFSNPLEKNEKILF